MFHLDASAASTPAAAAPATVVTLHQRPPSTACEHHSRCKQLDWYKNCCGKNIVLHSCCFVSLFCLSSLVPSDDVHGCIHCMSLSLFLIPSVQVAVRVIRIVVVALVLRAMLASCDDFHGCIRPWHVVIALLYYLSLKLPCVTFAMLLLLLSCCTVLHSCCFVNLMARCLPCILGLKWCA